VHDPVRQYAEDVRDGRIVACRYVRLACERHLRDLEQAEARGLAWDTSAALHVINFFPKVLRLAEGTHAGKPFVLQPWQQFIVGSLFGWKRSDGLRRFRTCYVEVAKGGGKSPLAAGIGLYMLIADGEAAAQIYSAATNRDQAKIVFNDACRMVHASDLLREKVHESVNNLAYLPTDSYFRPVSAESSSLDGLRPHLVIVDEVHEHPSAAVIDKLRAGFKGRRQPLIIEITNSGYDRHSVCFQHHEYSVKILEGTIQTDSWFAFVCALDEGDDWRDESVWVKANPNLGVSVTREYLAEQVQEAVDMPAKANIVRRLNFCEWTEQSERAIDMEMWNAGGPPPTADWRAVAAHIQGLERELAGRLCFGGIDLAKVSDLSAWILLFPPSAGEGLYHVLCRFFVPEEDILVRSKRDRVPYDVWRDQGFLFETPGNVTDYDYIYAQVMKDAARFDVREIAFDRTFAGEIVQRLQGEGLSMVEFGQGFLSMAAPTAELLRLIKAGELHHGGHPVLRWNASNLAVATDPAGNMKPDKSRRSEKIDGIVALCNALGRAMARPTSDYSSVYETRGLLLLG